jgi:hypothetical protein
VCTKPPDEFAISAPKGIGGFGLSSISPQIILLFSRHDLLQIKKKKRNNLHSIISIPPSNANNN